MQLEEADDSSAALFKVKNAPSANWQEIVGLWQCHNETYEQFFDPITRQLRVPQDTLLFNANVLEAHSSVDFTEKFP